MEPSEEILLQEIVALWRTTFGEPPPVIAEFDVLSSILVKHLPPAPPYQPFTPERDVVTSAARNP